MMDKRKAQSIIIMIVALILAALFMLSSMKKYADDVDDNLYEASTQNLREVYGQLNQKFLTIVQMQWNQLEMTADFISEADNDVDKVSAYLGKWNEEWKYTEFYFFRDDSSYYRLDGASGYLMTGSAWKTLVLDRQNVVFDGSMPGGEALTFFAVPVEPSEIAGFKYCAVAIAYDTDALNRELGVTAYDKHSSSYMVYENGDIALKAIESIDIGSNVLYYLKRQNSSAAPTPRSARTSRPAWRAKPSAQSAARTFTSHISRWACRTGRLYRLCRYQWQIPAR